MLQSWGWARDHPVRPNIVVIVADDLGYGDLSSYGGTIATPHLDALATGGVRFVDFHANGAMCSPTRAAFLTGRYQQRSGIETALPISPDVGLPLQPTLASDLKAEGYATGALGKWHLGDAPRFRPAKFGFDEFYGLTTGDGDYHSQIDRSGNPDWWRGDESLREEGYTTDLITEHSIDFIDRHKNKPFFLYVAHLAVHFPWQSPEDSADRVAGTDYRPGVLKFGTNPDKRKAFRAMVRALDESVGRLMFHLRESGLEQNTVVFFFSDNGGYTQDHGGYVGVSSNGPFRGQKSDPYEGGHRVPGIAYWPGHITPGRVSEATVMSMDLKPTIMEMVGARSQDSAWGDDGISLVPHLVAGSPLPPRRLFWRMQERHAVRDGSWKLVVNGKTTELYDLARDPGETNDLARQEPERVQRLTQAFNVWEQDVENSHRVLERTP